MSPFLLLSLLFSFCFCELKLAVGVSGKDTLRWDESKTTLTREGSSSVYKLQLTCMHDNDNDALPGSFRRWWHVELTGAEGGEQIDFTVLGSTYADVVQPVWSVDAGEDRWLSYERLLTPVVGGSRDAGWTFRLTLPSTASDAWTKAGAGAAGSRRVRVAKFFPYPVRRMDALVAELAASPRVSAASLGKSALGQLPLHELTFGVGDVHAKGRPLVWVHAGAHPAETTSYFLFEGLARWLTAPADQLADGAKRLLRGATIVAAPMLNPDGVERGNYRTSARSVNIENEYKSDDPDVAVEAAAVRARIKALATPDQPLIALFNLHSAHVAAQPRGLFHFQVSL